jgi:hypothetical protein
MIVICTAVLCGCGTTRMPNVLEYLSILRKVARIVWLGKDGNDSNRESALHQQRGETRLARLARGNLVGDDLNSHPNAKSASFIFFPTDILCKNSFFSCSESNEYMYVNLGTLTVASLTKVL